MASQLRLGSRFRRHSGQTVKIYIQTALVFNTVEHSNNLKKPSKTYGSAARPCK